MTRWTRPALPVALAAVLLFSVRARGQPDPLRPVSVQMHAHASISDGNGNWRAANVHAKRIGLNVLWWSDLDGRMSCHTQLCFGFEGLDLKAIVPLRCQETRLRELAGADSQ